MPKGWSKGYTKHTHLSVRKISETMKRKRIDNFVVWREKAKKEYRELKKNGDLAELIGVTLGDGTITKYARTEELRITSNANNPGFVERYRGIILTVFGKEANIIPSNQSRCIKISLYEKHISTRLDIPIGKRRWVKNAVPGWILAKDEYIVRYLRGLYEAEGSFCVHEPTYTYKFIFSNKNESMLENVFQLLVRLGFHPHRTHDTIQVSRKIEVFAAKRLIKFREY